MKKHVLALFNNPSRLLNNTGLTPGGKKIYRCLLIPPHKFVPIEQYMVRESAAKTIALPYKKRGSEIDG